MASFLVKCGQGKTETRKATEHCWPKLMRIGEFQTHC
jgi:hypothetical protein